jgi:hypothetical protein
MNQIKHVTGPLKYERPSRVQIEAGHKSYGIYKGTDLHPEWVAEIHFMETYGDVKHDERIEATIRLFSLAPEMFEFIDRFLENFGRDTEYPVGSFAWKAQQIIKYLNEGGERP